MQLEYLEDEWFDCCRNIVETAEKLGYKAIWLYDEFNWPSGQCGGKTMQHSKDFQLKTLHAKRNQDGTKSFEIVYNPKFPDLLNPEAVAFFIENTYDKYFQRLGKHFGTLIKGIFSDEPRRDTADTPTARRTRSNHMVERAGRRLLGDDRTSGIQ